MKKKTVEDRLFYCLSLTDLNISVHYRTSGLFNSFVFFLLRNVIGAVTIVYSEKNFGINAVSC